MKYLFMALLLIVSGCATANMNIGKDFDATKCKQIIKNRTIKSEILNLFGQPYSTTVTPDGESWKYYSQKIKSTAQSLIVAIQTKTESEIKSLDIKFERDTVSDYSYTFQPFDTKEPEKPKKLEINDNPYIKETTIDGVDTTK